MCCNDGFFQGVIPTISLGGVEILAVDLTSGRPSLNGFIHEAAPCIADCRTRQPKREADRPRELRSRFFTLGISRLLVEPYFTTVLQHNSTQR